MIFYYRFFGLVADIALFLNLIFIMAIFSMLGVTLSLAGMAAMVLTVGMAVDAKRAHIRAYPRGDKKWGKSSS